MPLKNNVPLRIGIRQNTNVKSTGYRKWYGEVILRQGLTQRGFIKHIMDHIPGINETQVTAVIETITQCLPELVGHGISVKLDGIGVFYPTLNSQKKYDKNGQLVKDYQKTEAQMLSETIQPSDVVRGVRFRFKPDSTKLDNLTSKKFKDQTSIEVGGVILKKDVKSPSDPNSTVEMQVVISMEDYRKSITVNN